MTPNWFADGQHMLTLGGGTLIFVTQLVNFWRTTVMNQRVSALHHVITDNDKEILAELSVAQRSLNTVVDTITGGGRRRNPPGTPPPSWANGGRGRRSGDLGSPPPAPA